MMAIPLMKKLNVLVPHWIEHNDEHIAEMEKYLHALDAEGHKELAQYCRDVIAQMTAVSEKLTVMEQQLKPISLRG